MYREDGDTIILEMNRDDYENLLAMLGAAAGRASQDRDKTLFWTFLDFTNRLLEGSPRFRPYAVPEQYRTQPDANPPAA
jgi:hypothetical protein